VDIQVFLNREDGPPRTVAERRTVRLGWLQVHSARATAAIILELIGDTLLAIQGAHAGGLNRADVHESVAASIFRLDEAITFVGIEELYGSSDHFDFSFCGGPPIGPPVLGEARRRKRSRKAPKTV